MTPASSVPNGTLASSHAPLCTSTRIESRNCWFCKKDRQKCLRSGTTTAACDRCVRFGYACTDEDPGPLGYTKRRKCERLKCTSCREAKQKCLPVERTWPEKCHRCDKLRLACSEPTAVQAVSSDVAKGGRCAPPRLEISQTIPTSHNPSSASCKEKAYGISELQEYVKKRTPNPPTEKYPDWVIRTCVQLLDSAYSIISKLTCNALESSGSEVERLESGKHLFESIYERTLAILDISDPIANALFEWKDYFGAEMVYKRAIPIRLQLVAMSRKHEHDNEFYTTLSEQVRRSLSKITSIYEQTGQHLAAIEYYQMVIESSGKLWHFVPLFVDTLLEDFITICDRLLQVKQTNLYSDSEARETPLHHAMGIHNKRLIETLISRYRFRVDDVNALGQTSLHLAIQEDNWPAVESLIDAGVQVNIEDKFGEMPLFLAARSGNREMVRKLMAAGADVQRQSPTGKLPLDVAVTNNHSVVACLLARVTPPSMISLQIFNTVCARGFTDVAQVLIQKFRTSGIERALCEPALLITAVANGRFHVVKLLLRNGFPVDICCGEPETPDLVDIAISKNQLAIAEALLKWKPNLFRVEKRSITNNGNLTRLQAAAMLGDKAILEMLLQHGALPDSPAHEQGMTALQAASKNGHETCVVSLLASGASRTIDAYSGPDDGVAMTALQFAAFEDHVGVMEMLLEGGADVNAPAAPESGCTALQAACKNGDKALTSIKLLLRRGADIDALPAPYWGRTALQAACLGGSKATGTIQLLLDYRADPNIDAAGNWGVTALQAACKSGDEAIGVAQKLLAAGANVNAHPAKVGGFTALQEACLCGDGAKALVSILLDAKASINAPAAEDQGLTALQAACHGGSKAIVERLLSLHAKVNASPAANMGLTALQAACSNGERARDIVSLLLRNGADVNAKSTYPDNYPQTALDFLFSNCYGQEGQETDEQCDTDRDAMIGLLYRHGARRR